MSTGAAILPAALAHLAAADPQITVTTSEGTTPSLIRALRAGSLDLAVLTSRPPHRPFDGDSPRLHVETFADTELVVAVPSTGEFAGRTTVHVTSWSTPRGSPPVIELRAAARRLARPARPAAHHPLRTRLADEAPAGRWRLRRDDGGVRALTGAVARDEPAARRRRTPRDPQGAHGTPPGQSAPAITTVTRAITSTV
ncbi:LysR family transcriptional regulator substrate-binding protein [Streptomyces sp. NPDC059349]|uniref:LysR family transcriptional regulator substrate-binding protein n=1 Tax=Streptomyces sp. NPDC059349 TaxID=3346808 RepID=UPI0036ADB438